MLTVSGIQGYITNISTASAANLASAVGAYYNYIADNGVAYGDLANQVATDSGFVGAALKKLI